MSTDYAEMERDFVASLKEDTGRDLAGWMAAIGECGHSDRNAIIDWLRHQGFQFSWASWLERIHHNGGRLIYADDVGHAPPTPIAGAKPPDVTVHVMRPFQNVPRPSPPPRLTKPAAPPGHGVEGLLADAKGLRPLADLVLREIARTVPNVEFTTKGSFIAIGAPQTFAALVPSPKALRLYANFGAAGVHRAKAADAVNRSATTFSEVLVLDDARSIDEDFLRLIRAAARL
jgi:hypothetical protein